MDKKKIIAIVAFLFLGFFMFTFANPGEEELEKVDKKKVEEKVKDTKDVASEDTNTVLVEENDNEVANNIVTGLVNNNVATGNVVTNQENNVGNTAVEENNNDENTTTEENKKEEPTKEEEKTFTVSFVDYYGKVISTQVLTSTDEIEVPTSLNGTNVKLNGITYLFSGWDKEISEITTDSVVKALYRNIYGATVKTFLYNGQTFDFIKEADMIVNEDVKDVILNNRLGLLAFNNDIYNYVNKDTLPVSNRAGYEYIWNNLNYNEEGFRLEGSLNAIDYEINIGEVENGTIEVEVETANVGDTVTVTATPSTGYELESILVNGEAIEGNTFEMPAGDVEITATFTQIDYSITVGEVENGTVSVDSTTAHLGDTITITATPSTGYELESILVNGEVIEGNTIEMPAGDVEITATFTQIDYSITVGEVENGTVSVDSTTAHLGDTITITATPSTGYELESISVNGEAIEGNTFEMPASDVEITATFTQIDYSITVGEVENGTVSVDSTTAHLGDTITITATPAQGYELENILVNGEAIEGNTFTVTGAATITATFNEVLVSDFVVFFESGYRHHRPVISVKKVDTTARIENVYYQNNQGKFSLMYSYELSTYDKSVYESNVTNINNGKNDIVKIQYTKGGKRYLATYVKDDNNLYVLAFKPVQK